mmetsp:Transcript_28735/g.69563  ORF Transcript_28735/g.69563 Transcript_28735/m.69563 type:complete len:252 (-) Transcript_28735:277-1032(-)
MSSKKTVRFYELIRHSDHEISYLGTHHEDDADDAEHESNSSGGESSTEGHQRWSLTEGMPPSLPTRSNSPLTSGKHKVPPNVPLRRTSPPHDHPDHPRADQEKGGNDADADTTSLMTPPQPKSSNVAIKGSLDGDMHKIAKIHISGDDHDDEKDSKSLFVNKKPDCGSERSVRSIVTDLASTDHWSPLTDFDSNDYSPPILPRRRASAGNEWEEGDFKTEQKTLSTLPDDEDEDDLSHSWDYDVPPLPFDN